MTGRTFLCGLSLCLSCATYHAGYGQSDTLPLPDLGVIVIETADPGVWSLLDGRVLGRGSLRIDSVAAGTHIVRCIPGSITAWGVPETVDTVALGVGDTARVVYPRRGMIVVESTPAGARVMIGDSLVGTTPLALPASARSDPGRIILERDGYARAFLPPAPGTSPYLRITLENETQDQHPESVLSASKFASPGVLLTGSGAFFSGVAAAWLKIKADEKGEEYLAGGNPALRSQIDRLDTWGGVSLAVCQVLLVYLAYQLLVE
jgi:hypothetical protein